MLTRSRSLVTLTVLALTVLAGCVTPANLDLSPSAESVVPDLAAAFEWDHDHESPDAHALSWNARSVAHLAPELEGFDGVSFGEIDVDHERDLAFVHVLGANGGFSVFDVADPAKPVFLHFEQVPRVNACIGDVKVGPLPATVVVAAQCNAESGGPPHAGFLVYDVTNASAPRWLGWGAHGLTCHMVATAVVDDVPYVYCAGSSGPSAWRLEQTDLLPAQGVLVNPNLVQEPGVVEHAPLAVEEFGVQAGPRFMLLAHDMTTQEDPLTGEPIVIASHAYSGVRIIDGKDPAAGNVLGSWAGEGASDYSWIHTAQAVEWQGKRIVVAITENVVDTPPRLWVLDFTDYAKPTVLAEYALAGQDDSHGLAFSLHNFQLVKTDDGRLRMYVAAYHAGVWVIDLTDPVTPTPVAFALTHAESPYAFPDGTFFGIGSNWVGQVWDVVVKDGHVLAADMQNGFHVLHFDGDPVADTDHSSFG